MDKVCRWCKYYENGYCVKAEANLIVEDNNGWDEITDTVKVRIKEPESFYCSKWE